MSTDFKFITKFQEVYKTRACDLELVYQLKRIADSLETIKNSAKI